MHRCVRGIGVGHLSSLLAFVVSLTGWRRSVNKICRSRGRFGLVTAGPATRRVTAREFQGLLSAENSLHM